MKLEGVKEEKKSEYKLLFSSYFFMFKNRRYFFRFTAENLYQILDAFLIVFYQFWSCETFCSYFLLHLYIDSVRYR